MIRNFGAKGIVQQPQGIDLGLGGGSIIKSIQRGSTSLGSSTNQTVNINAVDLSKAAVYISTRAPQNGYFNTISVEADFLSSTQLRLRRNYGEASLGAIVYWTVIEFEKVKSLQTGRVTYGGLTLSDVTISQINTTKSLLFFSYQHAYGNDQGAFNYLIAGGIVGNTTIRFESYSQTTPVYITWYVIEFD